MRRQMEGFLRGLPKAVSGMEACGGAHYWARLAQACGHEVRLMPPAYVKPYVKRNKTDGRDAEAICEAMQRPAMRFIAVKTPEQQAVLSLHRSRSLMVRQRIMIANALRAQLAEFGVVAAQGRKGLQDLIGPVRSGPQAVPMLAWEALRVLAAQWHALDDRIGKLELAIVRSLRQSEAGQRLLAVPGVGPITASAVVASMGDARIFHSARGFAAWLGLAPR
jgi:transposase